MPVDEAIARGAHKQCAVRADDIDGILHVKAKAAKK